MRFLEKSAQKVVGILKRLCRDMTKGRLKRPKSSRLCCDTTKK
jgi:hypothetical protein